jgi:hypothetical protein
MVQHHFESAGGALISLRSFAHALILFPPLAGQAGAGCCPIPLEPSDQALIRAIHQKVERDALSASQDFFGYNS